MAGPLKPLIFIEPMTPTLVKMRDAMVPSATAEGIEILNALIPIDSTILIIVQKQ